MPSTRMSAIPPAWKVLGGFSVIMLLGGGALWASTVGIFLSPLEREFGWSHTQVYLGVTITYLMTPLVAPLVGWLLDRGRVRQLIVGALLLQALVFFGMSRMGPSLGFYYALCVLMFATVLGVTPMPLTLVINGWFTDKRGLALGILFCLNFVGAMLAPLVAPVLIEHLGWRGAYTAFGAAVFVFAASAAMLWVRENPGRQMAVQPEAGQPTQRGVLLAAIKQREFRIIAVWLLLYGYSFNGISFHLVPLLQEHGLSVTGAAAAQSLLGLGGLGGNLLAGYFLDRIHAPRLASVFAAFPLVGLLLLSIWPERSSGYLMALSLGLAVGSEGTILMYVGGRYFAAEVLGRVMALLVIVVTLGAAAGPAVAALLHDRFGGYQELLVLNQLTFLLSAVMPFGLKAYRY